MGHPIRILLAEDDDVVRKIVAEELRDCGFEVVEASSGGEMLVHIARTYYAGDAYFAYDLILSDVRMPTANGLQILETLRRAHWTTPVILMTALSDKRTREQAKALGAVLFEKPLDLDQLREKILEMVH